MSAPERMELRHPKGFVALELRPCQGKPEAELVAIDSSGWPLPIATLTLDDLFDLESMSAAMQIELETREVHGDVQPPPSIEPERAA